jgi:hypothetical protein
MNAQQRRVIEECLNIIQGHRYISIGRKLKDVEERLQALLEKPNLQVENVSQTTAPSCSCEPRP